MREAEVVKTHKMFRRWDLLLVLILVVIIVFAVLAAFQPKGSFIEVYRDGRLIKTIALSADAEFELEGCLTVVVKDGKVSVKDAQCPDKLCERAVVDSAGSAIICLPQKIVIKIPGKVDVAT